MAPKIKCTCETPTSRFCRKCYDAKKYLDNPELNKARACSWQKANPKPGDPEVISRSGKKYYQANKDKLAGTHRLWREANPQYSKDHYAENKKSVLQYKRTQRAVNPNWRLADNIRSRMRDALKGNIKPLKMKEALGCTLEELRIHLESQFVEGMSWDNYGRADGCWSLDHIKPLSSFDLSNIEQYRDASNYKNLQPLWHIDNIRKGNKIDTGS